MTCPLSYHPNLDELVVERSSGATSEFFLLRGSQGWHLAEVEEALAHARMGPSGGNAAGVAQFTPRAGPR